MSILSVVISLPKAHAAVTYLNCPTLAPLPITNFMPAAMLPILNAKTAFDTGMNVTINNAVTYASIRQTTAINDAFSSMMKNMIQVSRSGFQQKIELDRSFDRLEQSYKSELASKEMQFSSMFFPGDPALQKQPDGTEGVVSPQGPTYKFVQQLCNTGKIQQALSKPSQKDKAIAAVNRRNQKLTQQIQSTSSVQASAKRIVDAHFDLFCSEADFNNGLCEQVSVAPNADLSAFNFLYPVGYKDENKIESSAYQSLYTYSPVESMASYQFVKNLTGVFGAAPPSETERNDPGKSRFVGFYKQLVAANSVATDSLLRISQKREPINKVGLKLGELDLLGYQLAQSSMPENRSIYQSASDTGKLKEIQRQIALNNYIKMLILQQKDAMRRIDAAEVSIQSSLEYLPSK